MLKGRVNLNDRAEKLRSAQEQVHKVLADSGLVGDNCRTVCEDHLVVVNGELQHQVVCHTVCDN